MMKQGGPWRIQIVPTRLSELQAKIDIVERYRQILFVEAAYGQEFFL
jgi:hypothetical protein